MPSPQTVIAITLAGSILGGVAAALFIYDWIRVRAKAARAGGVTPILRWPELTLTLVISAVLCSAIGLWLLFHLPKPVACPAPPPAKESSVNLQASPSLLRAQPPKHPKVAPQVGSQVGTDNTQINIGGGVKQGGNGDCQQNVIGGNNNTNTCAPPEARIGVKVSNLRKVGDDYQRAVMFSPDIELASNIAFTVAFDNTVSDFDVNTSLGPAGVFKKINTSNNSAHANNLVGFSVTIFPPTIPANGWITLTVHSKSPINFVAWRRGLD